ncbi:transmembrane protein, putative (macronuclear) [Tetrahymena thermophila SB210]|uniref:Transmembrane protein, putative n=1 Tax=Tetrahymena thermophila (strain SB210) TaxID=312017 RepID=Q22NY8_TETTS|nr:transmembrane protein, putative [Tetrahymena thermophila SB210]EAR87023.3 transmembrane protein, putative [Tetrahymena thermophila SB210]|eukprot:XP_001007268.3 transmembrane protein, putative [Tetrahymena thermophila SB210]
MVSIVNIVNLKQSDTFSYAIYIIAMSFMVFYFIYVGCLTIVTNYLKEINDEFQKIISTINEILNLYFTLFLNVFLSFYLEINCSLIFCSKKSMLSNMRHQFYDPTILTCTIPTFQVVLGIFGLFLTLLTALLTNYYFRNYEFLEKNILKRKFTILYFSLTALRVVITFVEFQWQNQNMLVAKHVIAQIFGIVSIVDYFLYLPYTDQIISKYYLNVIAFYQSAVTCSNFYFWLNVINGQEMFYLTVLLGLIFRAVLDQTLNFKYDYIMQGNWKTERIINNLDFYLEQIIQLGQQCATQEEAKTKLYKIYKLHQINCNVPNCVCHKYQKLNIKTQQEQEIEDNLKEDSSKDIENNNAEDSGINMLLLYQFVDVIFKWMFSQKCITQNKSQFQKLSLKYISFMVKYQNNPVRAYQELKILQLKSIQFSIFFEILSQIIEVKIQNTILNQQEISESNSTLSSSKIDNRNNQKLKQVILHNELRIDVLLEVEKLCLKYISTFLEIIDEKQGLWSLLQNGYKDIDGFQKDALKLMRKISLTRTQFQKQTQQIKQEMPDIEICIQFQKLIQIFYLFVINDTVKAIQLDLKINELKKRDTLSEENQLKNTNLLKGEICLLEISLAENMGKILSKRDDKTAQFFGYNDKQDFLKINNINSLMPAHIGRVHNQIVKDYIKGKKNKLKGSKQIIQSFMKLKDGFIHPVSIFFRFNFTTVSNDFILNGVILKENSQKDYIIFDRSGKVTGITKNLAKNILFDFPTLPPGDALIKRMNFLLIFPKIVKKLINFRDLILNDLQLKQQFGNQKLNFEKTKNQKDTHSRSILLDDQSSSTIIYSNLSNYIRKFMNFINKKSQNSQHSQYDQLDLLDKSCLSILKQFEEQDLDDQNTNRSNLSSERRFNKTLKSEDEKYFTKEFTKKSMSMAKQAQNNIRMKMKYNYQIQYRIIDKEDQKKINQNVISRNQNFNQKEGEKIKSNRQKDVYFVICFKNIQISQFHQKQKVQNKNKFLSNIYEYLYSTTSIIPLSNSIKGIKFSPNQQSLIIEQQSDSPLNQKITNLSTQIIDCMSPNQQKQNETGLSFTQNKMIKKFLKSIHQKNNNQQQKDQKNVGDTDDQFQDDNLSSNLQSSLNVSFNTDESYQVQGFQQDEINKQIQSLIKNKTNFSGDIDDSFPELDELFQKYSFQKSQLTLIDKNTQIKKILQNRSLSSSFGKALEVAVSEALIQKQLEKQQYQAENKINYYHTNNNEIETYQPVTFRQGFEQQEMELSFEKTPQNIRQKLEPTYNIQINNNLYNISYQNLDQSNIHSQIVENNYNEIDFSNRVNFIDNHQQDNANTSLFISKQKYKDPNQHQNDQNFLNISARPILDQSYRSINQIQTDQVINNTQIYLNGVKYLEDYSNKNNQENLILPNQSSAVKQNKLITTASQIDVYKQQIPSTDNIEYQKISLRNSSDRQDIQDNSNNQEVIQEKIIANILNKKGMIANGKNSIQTSVHSSRSSSSYAGFFLKDIIVRSKVPQAAKNYRFLLILFLLVFLALNITNLVVIQGDIEVFSENVQILKYPRKFLRAYGKAFFGYYIQIQIQLGFLKDTSDQQYMSLTDDYILRGVQEYKQLSDSYSTQLTKLVEEQIQNQEQQLQTYYLFKNREQAIFNITKSLMYPQHLYYLLILINEKSQMQRTDSFLYLRQNYFSFSQNIIDQVDLLINDTIDASNSLIFKFQVINIIAIILIVVIALTSLPIIRQINFYEEKIVMILTRINFEQSEVEKTKYTICKQLINIELVEWMSYNYFDIFSLSCKNGDNTNQTNRHSSNSKNNGLKERKEIKKLPKSKVSNKQISQEQSNIFQKSSIFNLKQAQESQLTLNQNVKHQINSQNQDTKNVIQSENIISSNAVSSKQKLKKQNISSNTNHRSQSNQILQARIQNQKLGIFRRFLTFFILAFIICIYYICIIIYLNQSDDQIKIPVQMNQNSIKLHALQTNFKIAVSLLSFDQYIQDELWSNYSIKDLQEYQNQMGSSFNQVQAIMQSITSLIYGKNPFSSLTVQQLKDIQEGKGCQYLQVYQCQPQEVLGLTLINANNQKFLSEYPNILNVQKSDYNQLIEYFNGYAYKSTILFSFREQDEIYDIYSSFINQSITQVSLSIQQFIQNYLIIGCIFITLAIIISEYISWKLFFSRIQMMNLLLTMIPEEKLQEEATLHMIRQLHRM